MDIVILIIAMVAVGLLMGWAAGLIWKGSRPMGVTADYSIAVATTIVVGLLDWYVIPAMDFSDTMRNIGVAIEPPLAALLVLWIIRKVKK
jgi:uncharacterized membrane protein YeaQ/YmgE (transglycosylase-associated protein family)